MESTYNHKATTSVSPTAIRVTEANGGYYFRTHSMSYRVVRVIMTRRDQILLKNVLRLCTVTVCQAGGVDMLLLVARQLLRGISPKGVPKTRRSVSRRATERLKSLHLRALL
jgi:hypothetical protein